MLKQVKSQLDNLLIDYRDDVVIKYREGYRNRSYLPDFYLYNNIIVDVYDTFRWSDRKRYTLLREQYPLLDIRVVFYLPHSRIPDHYCTYGGWCISNNILWSCDYIPESWLRYNPPQYNVPPQYIDFLPKSNYPY